MPETPDQVEGKIAGTSGAKHIKSGISYSI
jgi:hypothetical protein